MWPPPRQCRPVKAGPCRLSCGFRPDIGSILPNTIFLTVYRPRFCNKAARAALEERGIIVSVGSACNTASAAPSGVVHAMGRPLALQDGVLRISLCDDTTAEEIKAFVRNFLEVVVSGECLRSATAEEQAAPVVARPIKPSTPAKPVGAKKSSIKSARPTSARPTSARPTSATGKARKASSKGKKAKTSRKG